VRINNFWVAFKDQFDKQLADYHKGQVDANCLRYNSLKPGFEKKIDEVFQGASTGGRMRWAGRGVCYMFILYVAGDNH
jgi:hypothetical protein